MNREQSTFSLAALKDKRRRIALAAILLVCGVLNFALYLANFDYVEAIFYDARMRLSPTPSSSGRVALVAIDKTSVSHFGHVPNARDVKGALELILPAKPLAVVYVPSLTRISGEPHELADLANLMASQQNVYAAVDDIYLKSDKASARLKPPFEAVRVGEMQLTSDRAAFARDDVSRRVLISYQGRKTLHAELAQVFNEKLADESTVRGVFEYLDSNQAYVNFRPKGFYRPTLFQDLLAVPADRFTGKIVLIGYDTEADVNDYLRTPLSRELNALTVLEAYANIIDTLILNDSPVRPPKWVGILLTCIISLVSVYSVLAMRPLSGMATILTLTVGFSLTSFGLFATFGLWIDMSHALLSIFVVYYFFVPYRLIVENRRSWEYFQKNQLLTEVEELKTNFLRMMSHDLKTPIARIQGMLDLVSAEGDRLSRVQVQAVSTLRRSADELLEFVTNILNLTRIESKEVKLHIASKDINSVISDVILKSKELADAKKIRIKSELEPMFSIKMDPDLIRQVLVNLFENAIKYSDADTEILVKSREQDGKVRIEITDSGCGIPSEELENIFTKFYRGKASLSSPIKGSGLGLYLAKYFVELHSGSISVASEVGHGSTFAIELPVDLLESDEAKQTREATRKQAESNGDSRPQSQREIEC